MSIFIIFLMFLSCGNFDNDPQNWDIFCYMAGDNDIHSESFNSLMKFVNNSWKSERVNVMFMCDGINKKNEDDMGLAGYYVLDDGNARSVKALGNIDSSSTDSFRNFIDYFCDKSNAKHCALVLWGHGDDLPIYSSDNMRPFLPDGSTGMTFQELVESINYLSEKRGRETDIVIFDACRGAYGELAMEISGKYLISSQETQAGASLNYGGIIKYLIKNRDVDPKTFAEKSVRLYKEYYEEDIHKEYISEALIKSNDCISAIDIHKFKELNLHFISFYNLVDEAITMEYLDKGEIKRVIEESYVLGSGQLRGIPKGIDLLKFIFKMEILLNGKEECSLLREKVKYLFQNLKGEVILSNYSRIDEGLDLQDRGLNGLSVRNIPFHLNGGDAISYSFINDNGEDLWKKFVLDIA